MCIWCFFDLIQLTELKILFTLQLHNYTALGNS